MVKFNLWIFLLISFGCSAQLTIDAGANQTICLGKTAQIGGNPTASGGKPPYTYSWSPTTMDNPSSANPFASPTSTTTYTLTVTDSTGSKTDSVRITLTYDSNVVANAGPDVTIIEGQNTTLHATGGETYYWTPAYNLTYPSSASADAEPFYTYTYTVIVTDMYGCRGTDDVTVNVIPSDQLYFYNTFTPNNDGNNDTWYIGNLYKYPDNQLKIYNRYGKLVVFESPYQNNWDGRSFTEELPSDTYFYVFTPGDGSKEYLGSVTIIR